MKVRMTLGRKVASGIALMLVLMVVVGGAGYYGLSRVLQELGFYNSMNDLQKSIITAKESTHRFMIACLMEQRGLQDKIQKDFQSAIRQSVSRVVAMKNGLNDQDASYQTIEKLETGIGSYKKSFDEYVGSESIKRNLGQDILETHKQLLGFIANGQMWIETMDLNAKASISAFQSYSTRQDDASQKVFQDTLSELGVSVDEWYNKIESSESIRGVGDRIKEQMARYLDLARNFSERVALQADLQKQMHAAMEDISKKIGELNAMSTETLQAQATFSNMLIFGFMGAALFIGIVYAAYSTRSIVGNIKKVIDGVSVGSAQVADGAGQVSAASNQLAGGASEQAAALEETSASLTEISSMTRQNANHAKTAKQMMMKAGDIVKRVNRHMEEMAVAMDEIDTSSEETGNIIKTIDEIAFQTNLLALNAAVEAARAGEAGAGFAVVADEVRNLAMRAAEAAKNTADRIENTINTVKNGSELTKRTQETFRENVETSRKITDLVNEIAAASEEQAEGIEQLNNAVHEMDRVVQQNAAISEESASAAQQMAGQAEHMKELIGEMEALVGKGNGSTGPRQRAVRTAALRAEWSDQPKIARRDVSTKERKGNNSEELGTDIDLFHKNENGFEDF